MRSQPSHARHGVLFNGSYLFGMLIVNLIILHHRGRGVELFDIVGGGVMFANKVYLTLRYGTRRMAIAKFIYGAFAFGMYLPLIRTLSALHGNPLMRMEITSQVCEEA